MNSCTDCIRYPVLFIALFQWVIKSDPRKPPAIYLFGLLGFVFIRGILPHGSATNQRLFGVVVSPMRFEPRGSAKWAVAGKVRNGRQVHNSNVGSFLHPSGLVFDSLPTSDQRHSKGPCQCQDDFIAPNLLFRHTSKQAGQ